MEVLLCLLKIYLSWGVIIYIITALIIPKEYYDCDTCLNNFVRANITIISYENDTVLGTYVLYSRYSEDVLKYTCKIHDYADPIIGDYFDGYYKQNNLDRCLSIDHVNNYLDNKNEYIRNTLIYFYTFAIPFFIAMAYITYNQDIYKLTPSLIQTSTPTLTPTPKPPTIKMPRSQLTNTKIIRIKPSNRNPNKKNLKITPQISPHHPDTPRTSPNYDSSDELNDIESHNF